MTTTPDTLRQTLLRQILDAPADLLPAVSATLAGQGAADNMQLFSVSHAARLLGVSRTTVWRWRKSALVRTVTLPGGSVRIPATEIRRLAGLGGL